MPTSKIGVIGAVIGIIVLLTGCVPEVAPTQTPIATSSPTPSASPTAPTRPASAFDVKCADLVPLPTVMAVLGTGVDLADFHLDPREQSPREFAVDARGGLSCAWTNGVAVFTTPFDVDSAYRAVTIRVIPQAGAQWQRFTAPHDVTAEDPAFGDQTTGVTCDVDGDEPASCEFEALVGSAWVRIDVRGVGGEAAVSVDEAQTRAATIVTAAVAGLRPVANAPVSTWVPPTQAPSNAASCNDVVSPDRAAAALNETSAEFETPGGGWSQESAAVEDSGTLVCIVRNESSYAGAYVTMLPGGSWGALVMERLRMRDRPEYVAIPGIGAKDALVSCSDATWERCTVDVRIGSDWVQVQTTVEYDQDFSLDALKARAISLATAIVEQQIAA